jgi:hypothetical protein
MPMRGKRWLLLGYALTYAAGASAYTALSTQFVVVGKTATSDAMFLGFAAAFQFVLILGCALGFVLLAGILDILTARRPQPLSALSLGLAVFVTIELLIQVLFLNAYTNYAVLRM